MHGAHTLLLTSEYRKQGRAKWNNNLNERLLFTVSSFEQTLNVHSAHGNTPVHINF